MYSSSSLYLIQKETSKQTMQMDVWMKEWTMDSNMHANLGLHTKFWGDKTCPARTLLIVG